MYNINNKKYMAFEEPKKINKNNKKNIEELKKEDIKDNVQNVLTNENKDFFNEMSISGQNIVKKAYENITKSSGADILVDKMKVAYNQFWSNSNQRKAAEMKDKIDNLDTKVKILDQSKNQISEVIDDLKSKNIPGVGSLELKIKEIENNQNKLLEKKDKIQTKFEEKNNEAKLYNNKRDKIASKLIDH